MDPTKGEVIVRCNAFVPLHLMQDPTFHSRHTFRSFCNYTLPFFEQAVDAHFQLSKYHLRRGALVHEDGLDFLAAQRKAHDTGQPVIFRLDAINISEHAPQPVTSLVGPPDLGECEWKVGNVTVIRKSRDGGL